MHALARNNKEIKEKRKRYTEKTLLLCDTTTKVEIEVEGWIEIKYHTK